MGIQKEKIKGEGPEYQKLKREGITSRMIIIHYTRYLKIKGWKRGMNKG